MPQEPKRHHYVPRAYLERFSEAGKVYVRWRDGRAYETSPVNVAVESGFYHFVDDAGRRTAELENRLAEVDTAALEAIRRIDASGQPPSVGHPDRVKIARFIAVQLTRTPESRARVEFADAVERFAAGATVTEDLVRRYLREVHLRFEPTASETQAAFDFVSVLLQPEHRLTPTQRLQLMFSSTSNTTPVIEQLNWTLETDRKSGFGTSDSPEVLWRRPSARDRFEGVGILNAEELRFPLDPEKQLVLTTRVRPPTKRVTPARSAACLEDTAAACYRFVVVNPKHQRRIADIIVAPHRPALRFNVGPELVQRPDGSLVETGKEILHTWIQRR